MLKCSILPLMLRLSQLNMMDPISQAAMCSYSAHLHFVMDHISGGVCCASHRPIYILQVIRFTQEDFDTAWITLLNTQYFGMYFAESK